MDHTEARGFRAIERTPQLQNAWPWDWENRPTKDRCGHVWEMVVVDRLFDPHEVVARCVYCHTPRCGYAEDADPCNLRRNHAGDHATMAFAGAARPSPEPSVL